MKNQKIIKLLDDTTNEPSKFKTRNWVEKNDKSRGVYNVSEQIKFQTSTIRSNLCDHSNAYIYVKGTISVTNTGATTASNNKNQNIIFKKCSPFTNCIGETNYTQIDDAHDFDVVAHMYSIIEYRDIHSNTSGNLW